MLSELQVITSLLLPKGCISLSGTYEESGASYVICVTLAQLKLFLPRRPRRSRRCDGHVIPNALTHFTDQLYDRFDIKLEHLVFEHLGQPDLSTFFIRGRVESKKIGRDLPSGVLGFALPLRPKRRTKTPLGKGPRVARDR